MSWYRKKPVEVEAAQFTGDNALAMADWVNNHGGDANGDVVVELLYVDTLEGRMTARPGDWIIRGVQGEFYPCRPDIFAATYEPAAAPSELARAERAEAENARLRAALARVLETPEAQESKQ